MNLALIVPCAVAAVVVLALLANALTWPLLLRTVRVIRQLESMKVILEDVAQAMRTNALSPTALKILAEIGNFRVDDIELDRMNELQRLAKEGVLQGIVPRMGPEDNRTLQKMPVDKTLADKTLAGKTEDGYEPVRGERIPANENKPSTPQNKPSTPENKPESPVAKPQPESPVIKPPEEVKKVAEKNDPNYQTLRGLQNENIFEDKNAKPKAPQQTGEMAKTKDPNYQTLAGLAPDVFGPPKGGGGGYFKAPTNPTQASPDDPNNQTMLQVNNDVFDNRKPKEPAHFKAPTNVAKADAKDPNYQTLANLNDDEIFDKKKK